MISLTPLESGGQLTPDRCFCVLHVNWLTNNVMSVCHQ